MRAQDSRQAIVCPACASSLIEFFAAALGPDFQMPEKPETVTCTGPREHSYVVLEVDKSPDGERLYTLGAEITQD
jgi:hypothetical protein